jgi:hypothetical protein
MTRGLFRAKAEAFNGVTASAMVGHVFMLSPGGTPCDVRLKGGRANETPWRNMADAISSGEHADISSRRTGQGTV